MRIIKNIVKIDLNYYKAFIMKKAKASPSSNRKKKKASPLKTIDIINNILDETVSEETLAATISNLKTSKNLSLSDLTLLGFCHLHGLGTTASIQKAAECLQKAAEQGEAFAQFKLGNFFENGWGRPQDLKQAAEWYQKAAAQGEASAQSNLGKFFRNGLGGLSQDLKQAAEWFQKAAEQGEAVAQFNLGRFFQKGWGGCLKT